MAILNSDGTPYQLSGLERFDPNSPEHELTRLWDSEIIQLSGSPIFYYEVFIQMNTVDELYQEDRGKLFSTVPIELRAYYEPITSQNAQTEFGIDALEEIEFQLNYRDVLMTIGHPPKVGSRIYTPHKRQNWIIVQRNVDDFRLWGELRLKLYCQVFQESLTQNEGAVTQPKIEPDFKIN